MLWTMSVMMSCHNRESKYMESVGWEPCACRYCSSPLTTALSHSCFFFPRTLSPGKSQRIWQDPSWCHICKTQLSPILTTCQVINERVKMTTATLASNILLPLPSTNLTPGMWELSWQHYVQTVPVMTWSPLKYWKQFSLIDWLIHHPKQYGQILQVKFCMCSESVFQRTDFTWESLFCYETDPWEPTHTELAKGLFSSSPVLAYHVSLACLYSLHN